MKKLQYIFLMAMSTLFCLACNEDSLSTFDEDEGLKTEFPAALFEFSFDYTSSLQGEQIADIDSFHFPVPLDHDSFTAFEATSEVRNNSGIRYVRNTLDQGLYLKEDTLTPGSFYWIDGGRFVIKLNVATSGDAINGEPYEKAVLLDFLQEGKIYPTEKNQLGAIELTYQKSYFLPPNDNVGKLVNAGIDQFGDIGLSDYSVKVVSVEDYEDRTREGTLIKTALKVIIEFEGVIGVSSNPFLPANLKADQWDIQNGRASFIVDYFQ